MKKFGLLIAGGIAAIVLLANIGPLIALAVSTIILYFAFRQFLKTESKLMKFGWAIIGIIVLIAAASNVPAILGIAAAYVLYLVYKKWNEQKSVMTASDDPFANFEKQWSDLNKN